MQTQRDLFEDLRAQLLCNYISDMRNEPCIAIGNGALIPEYIAEDDIPRGSGQCRPCLGREKPVRVFVNQDSMTKRLFVMLRPKLHGK